MQEMRAPSLGREDPLEEEMATHSSMLAGKLDTPYLLRQGCHDPPPQKNPALTRCSHMVLLQSQVSQTTSASAPCVGPEVGSPREKALPRKGSI